MHTAESVCWGLVVQAIALQPSPTVAVSCVLRVCMPSRHVWLGVFVREVGWGGGWVFAGLCAGHAGLTVGRTLGVVDERD